MATALGKDPRDVLARVATGPKHVCGWGIVLMVRGLGLLDLFL